VKRSLGLPRAARVVIPIVTLFAFVPATTAGAQTAPVLAASATTQTQVRTGASNQPAGDLRIGLGGGTTAGIAAIIEIPKGTTFAVALRNASGENCGSLPADALAYATTPVVTEAGSDTPVPASLSSSDACAPSVADVLTFQLPAPTQLITISGIAYNVGDGVPGGAVTAAVEGDGVPASCTGDFGCSDATVVVVTTTTTPTPPASPTNGGASTTVLAAVPVSASPPSNNSGAIVAIIAVIAALAATGLMLFTRSRRPARRPRAVGRPSVTASWTNPTPSFAQLPDRRFASLGIRFDADRHVARWDEGT
jgi:hypothetical protein